MLLAARITSVAVAGTLAGLLVACSPDRTEAPELRTGTVTDSAGIQIVDNPGTAPDSAPLGIAATPALVIGNDESRGEEYLFGWIMAAARLSTGHIVVADGQARDVRVFDSSGTFVRRIGRRGRGPGEFRGVSDLFVVADTIVVRGGYDGDPASLFTVDGTFVRSWNPDREAFSALPLLEGVWPDGSTLVKVSQSRNPRLQAPTPRVPTVIENAEQLLRAGPGGQILADFGEHPTERSVFYSNHPLAGYEVTAPAYLPQPRRTVTPTALYLTDGDPFEIRKYDLNGELSRIIRKAHTPASIAAGWADSTWQATVRRLAETEVGAWIGRAPPPPVPEHMPAIGQIVVDSEDNLWAGTPSLDANGPRTWFVFDADGILRHSVQTSLVPVQIGADYLLTIRRDDIGVWTVAVHELFRPAEPRPR